MLRRALVYLHGGLILTLALALLPLRTARAQDVAAEPAGDAPAVLAIGVVKGRSGTQVTIDGSAELAYEYSVIEGTGLVIDIPGAASRVWPAEQPVDDAFVSRVRVIERAGERPGVRVVFDLKGPDGFTVRGEERRIVVSFAPRPATATAALSATAAASPAAAAGPAAARTVRVTGVAATAAQGSHRVRIALDAPTSFRLVEQPDPRTVVVAVERARLDAAAAVGATAVAAGPVASVAAREAASDPPQVLVAMTLREAAPFRLALEGSGVNVDFAPPAAGGAAPAGAPAPGAAAAPAGPYTGAKITLDFVDAELSDIFRLIADVSGMNIITTDDVKGQRSVKMTDVPWDQALDLILKTNVPQLVKTQEAEKVLSISTLKRALDDQAAIEKQRLDQLRRAAEEQKQAYESAVAARKFEAEQQSQVMAKVLAERQRSKGWREKTFTISYGDTKEAAERLRKFYSGCEDGCIFEVGERSKTIFVRDFVDNVERMTAIIDVLEAPTPAVMVEARIVEVQNDYSKALGIQWGARFFADAQHGNATPFAFPNSLSMRGTAVEGSEGTNPGSYLVNLPASGATSGLGLTLGHVANTLSLDMKLSALESLGKTKILSNPKVLVVQNQEANINIGSQLPVPRTDAEGNRTIDWKDVGILLQVTPTVTGDGRVFMKLKIEKSAAGETVRTTEGDMFSIERRGAVTTVLVGDGETSVIGGIFQQTNTDNDDGVPGLSRLPLVGWLFKAKSAQNSRKELMIFLTPHISEDARDRGVRTAAAAPAPAAAGVFGAVGVLGVEPAAGGGALQVAAEYVNDTAFTFATSVTINCKAYAADGSVVGGEVAHLWAREQGPMRPGFRAAIQVPITLSGGGHAGVRCEAVGAE